MVVFDIVRIRLRYAEPLTAALITLLVSFPSLGLIQQYLDAALDSALIPLPTYISTFPTVILTSPDFLSRPNLWPRLISLALKAQKIYSTNPAGQISAPPSVLSDSAPPTHNAQTIESVIKLLAISYSLPSTHMPTASAMSSGPSLVEQITQDLTTLLVLLLSAISSPTHGRLPPTATASLISNVTELAETYPLGDAKLALDSWVLSFSLASGAMALEDGIDDFLGTEIGYEPSAAPQSEAPASETLVQDVAVTEEDLVSSTVLIRSLVRAFLTADLSHAAY